MAADPHLGELATSDLHALRLAAQVLRHKAELESRAPIADYFGRLVERSLVELAARGEGVIVIADRVDTRLPGTASRDDRRVLAEYFGLLIGNEQLSPTLRAALRALRARDCR
ncbi:MAG: hypothetical protein M3N29_11385 [Chloroflexota bacterium]|nr:hypothetical protein [Chloroflexota bacterium]